jgi:hypothetical protein
LTPDSFKDESVWQKLIEIANKEWTDIINEDYIMLLLANFDNEKLIFNNKVTQ